MRDPHVERLEYRFAPTPMTGQRSTEWAENAPPVEWQTEAFEGRLADGRLTIMMREHLCDTRRRTARRGAEAARVGACARAQAGAP
jgi:hypothetical protein